MERIATKLLTGLGQVVEWGGSACCKTDRLGLCARDCGRLVKETDVVESRGMNDIVEVLFEYVDVHHVLSCRFPHAVFDRTALKMSGHFFDDHKG